MSDRKAYGWRSAEPPLSFAYLSSPIVEILKERGAQKVLDIGAGNGSLCAELVREGFEVVGVEYDSGGCEIARESNPGIDFYNLGVQDDPSVILREHESGFDAVVSAEVIEHLYSPDLLPKFAAKLLGPGGHLVLTTPYHGYLKNLALSIAGSWDAHFSPLWEGGHIKFWSRATLTQLLDRNGFDVVAFDGAGRVPYLWKSMIIVARRQATRD